STTWSSRPGSSRPDRTPTTTSSPGGSATRASTDRGKPSSACMMQSVPGDWDCGSGRATCSSPRTGVIDRCDDASGQPPCGFLPCLDLTTDSDREDLVC